MKKWRQMLYYYLLTVPLQVQTVTDHAKPIQKVRLQVHFAGELALLASTLFCSFHFYIFG